MPIIDIRRTYFDGMAAREDDCLTTSPAGDNHHPALRNLTRGTPRPSTLPLSALNLLILLLKLSAEASTFLGVPALQPHEARAIPSPIKLDRGARRC